jgi:hypothetical protein
LRAFRQLSLRDKFLPGFSESGLGSAGSAGLDIKEQDDAAGLGGHLRNTPAHGSGSNNSNGMKNGLHLKVLFGQGGHQAMTKCSHDKTKGL